MENSIITTFLLLKETLIDKKIYIIKQFVLLDNRTFCDMLFLGKIINYEKEFSKSWKRYLKKNKSE